MFIVKSLLFVLNILDMINEYWVKWVFFKIKGNIDIWLRWGRNL